jgi:hypothetical protein
MDGRGRICRRMRRMEDVYEKREMVRIVQVEESELGRGEGHDGKSGRLAYILPFFNTLWWPFHNPVILAGLAGHV